MSEYYLGIMFVLQVLLFIFYAVGLRESNLGFSGYFMLFGVSGFIGAVMAMPIAILLERVYS